MTAKTHGTPSAKDFPLHKKEKNQMWCYTVATHHSTIAAILQVTVFKIMRQHCVRSHPKTQAAGHHIHRCSHFTSWCSDYAMIHKERLLFGFDISLRSFHKLCSLVHLWFMGPQDAPRISDLSRQWITFAVLSSTCVWRSTSKNQLYFLGCTLLL